MAKNPDMLDRAFKESESEDNDLLELIAGFCIDRPDQYYAVVDKNFIILLEKFVDFENFEENSTG